jgi:hypothetical protein
LFFVEITALLFKTFSIFTLSPPIIEKGKTPTSF